MSKFNQEHSSYDRNYRPTTFHRSAPSAFQPSKAIQATLKRKRRDEISEENEKPAKRTKPAADTGLGERKKEKVAVGAGTHPGDPSTPAIRGKPFLQACRKTLAASGSPTQWAPAASGSTVQQAQRRA
ncbi:hypothetical protein GGX14DRAFT_395587 [Mycena pura]|uniref:Uncharacterized protein n=1 Tax=Mycena pura TaxID=153505 RepID=A0AAD6VDI2_9AGAR|nr:hypothetical protein GGX14DRAFT_395587 [Mycena pura]